MRLVDHPDQIAEFPEPTPEAPWRVLLSGCIAGWGVAVDGSDYGLGALLTDLKESPLVEFVPFCPEDHAIGTPRTMPDIHGGDGHDVLEGRARVLDEHGEDLTDKMVKGANAMLDVARRADAQFAILTDMSAACGTQVISDGCRFDEPRKYQLGVGVAAATLLRAGIPVVSQRDYHTLGIIRERLGLENPYPDRPDHHRTEWVLENLGSG